MSASAVSTSISNMFRPSGSPERVTVGSFIFLVSSDDIAVIALKESEAGKPAVEPVDKLPSTSLTTTTIAISTQDVSMMSSESKVTPETTSAISTDITQATSLDFEEMSTSVNSVMSESTDVLQPTSTRTDSMTSSANEDVSISSKSTIGNPQSSTSTLDLQSSSQAAEEISSSLTKEGRSSQSIIPSSASMVHVESSSSIMDIQSSDSIMNMQSTEEFTDSSTLDTTTSVEIASLSSMETELTTFTTLMDTSSLMTSEQVSLMEVSSSVKSEQVTAMYTSSCVTSEQASLIETSISDIYSISNSYLSSEYHLTTMDTSTIEISSTIEPSSTSEFASSSVLLPVYALSLDDIIGVENVTTTLKCRLEGNLTLNSVKFLKDEEELTGTIEKNDQNTNFQYTLSSPTCTDSGIYHCIVAGEEANLTATANITIHVPPGKPTVTVPFEIVEEMSKEVSLFVCTYQERIPAAQVRWTATNTTGHVLELLSQNFKEENQTDECALEATSQFYHGFTIDYNGSSVCCEVQQGNISFSSCETINIVEKDFCINKTNKIYEHPYSRRTYIQCDNDVVYMNQCGVGYCINVTTGACEDCGDSPEPTDPLSCVGRNYVYIPRETTYPDNCGDYDQCVNGDKQPGTCPGTFLRNDTSSFLCTNKYEESYCAHVGGELEKSTVVPSKCECGIKEYIPSESTYPDNCGTYVRCVHGNKTVQHCSDRSVVYFNIYEAQVTCTLNEVESYCSKVNASIIKDC